MLGVGRIGKAATTTATLTTNATTPSREWGGETWGGAGRDGGRREEVREVRARTERPIVAKWGGLVKPSLVCGGKGWCGCGDMGIRIVKQLHAVVT